MHILLSFFVLFDLLDMDCSRGVRVASEVEDSKWVGLLSACVVYIFNQVLHLMVILILCFS